MFRLISRCTTICCGIFSRTGVHPIGCSDPVVLPAEMVANSAGNVDGYLGPDPFNQRAVRECRVHLQTVQTSGTGILLRLHGHEGIRETYPNVSCHVARDRRRDALRVDPRIAKKLPTRLPRATS